MKKKLLVVGSNSIHVHNFIDLVKENFDEVLLLTNKVNPEKYVPAVELDFSLGVQSFGTIGKIRKIVREFQPSVVHIQQANTYAFLTVLALKKEDIPSVLTAWGSDILLNPHKSFLLKKMVQYVLTHVKVVTADSNHVLNSAQKLVSKKLMSHNINFGITMQECTKSNKEHIIYSNRLHKELYNIDKVILSFSKFVKSYNEWKLVIAGSGSETENLKALVSKLDLDAYVDFVGFVNQEENHTYYCKSKIYISIPQSDSVSISLVEAILCDCVPFVSNLEANLELIEDGKNGFIENDLENVHFEKWLQIDTAYFEKSRDKLNITFSKEYNKNRYTEIYDEVCQ